LCAPIPGWNGGAPAEIRCARSWRGGPDRFFGAWRDGTYLARMEWNETGPGKKNGRRKGAAPRPRSWGAGGSSTGQGAGAGKVIRLLTTMLDRDPSLYPAAEGLARALTKPALGEAEVLLRQIKAFQRGPQQFLAVKAAGTLAAAQGWHLAHLVVPPIHCLTGSSEGWAARPPRIDCAWMTASRFTPQGSSRTGAARALIPAGARETNHGTFDQAARFMAIRDGTSARVLPT